ncbi:hypothetical protein BDV34DRAFT_229985 [Aspergillus parasiticus]|uniref:Alpha/Beta hydrolase protein n=1 Tax=Aspergillus parasiticus TaxID=5067 RepID=A0A5N6D8W8_ASPPA|nr:hypothetical protein BDV34DRAFT_229985 [Aspergillus parasiticus]
MDRSRSPWYWQKHSSPWTIHPGLPRRYPATDQPPRAESIIPFRRQRRLSIPTCVRQNIAPRASARRGHLRRRRSLVRRSPRPEPQAYCPELHDEVLAEAATADDAGHICAAGPGPRPHGHGEPLSPGLAPIYGRHASRCLHADECYAERRTHLQTVLCSGHRCRSRRYAPAHSALGFRIEGVGYEGVKLWYGGADVNTPPCMGLYLALRLHKSIYKEYAGEDHMSLLGGGHLRGISGDLLAG